MINYITLVSVYSKFFESDLELDPCYYFVLYACPQFRGFP